MADDSRNTLKPRMPPTQGYFTSDSRPDTVCFTPLNPTTIRVLPYIELFISFTCALFQLLDKSNEEMPKHILFQNQKENILCTLPFKSLDLKKEEEMNFYSARTHSIHFKK